MSPRAILPPRAFLPPRAPPPRLPSNAPLRRLAQCSLHPPGTLYVVSTPIGHLPDLSPRAAHVLRTAGVIAAEDTRVAGALLRSLHHAPREAGQPLLSFYEHNARTRTPALLAHLAAGRSVALVSDAGTPCVSDPGAELVAAAAAAGHSVVPVPGPCAVLAALVASGLPAADFWFRGFLPRPTAARARAVEQICAAPATVVLYEAPHRLLATLHALREAGDRPICLAREVTKKWEEFLRFPTVPHACAYYEDGQVSPRGEFTIVLGPLREERVVRETLADYTTVQVDPLALTEKLVREGVPASTVARCVAATTDVPKKIIYAHATHIKQSLTETAAGTGST